MAGGAGLGRGVEDGGRVGPAKTRYAKQAANLNGPAQNEWPHLVLRSLVSSLSASCSLALARPRLWMRLREHPHAGTTRGAKRNTPKERQTPKQTARRREREAAVEKKRKSDTDRE